MLERTLVNSTSPTIEEGLLFRREGDERDVDDRAKILDSLRRNRWSRERAAAELGISRVTLWRRMTRYGLYS